MLEKYWKCHNSPTSGPIETKLAWSHLIAFQHVRHDAVAMAMADARCIEQLAAMGVWRPNV